MRRSEFVSAVLATVVGGSSCGGRGKSTGRTPVAVEALPGAAAGGRMPLERALLRRRSQRAFQPSALNQDQISRLVWAAQGITDSYGHRTAPSAGALYPLEVYPVTAAGVGHYRPTTHTIDVLARGDRRASIQAAALGQEAVGNAPLLLVLTAVYARSEDRYGERGQRFAQLEAGHAAQNVLLEAVSLGLGAVPVGSFDDDALARAVGLPSEESALYVIAVGRPR